MDTMETKVCEGTLSQPSDKDVLVQQSLTELQTQMNEFIRGVDDYKKHLDMTENLQQLIEECHFWCEEASGTVVRVGKYSAECKTREAVQILYTQFQKFVHPTLAQQEERIKQIHGLATSVYGTEEGDKYAEKTIAKHKEAIDSVNELCSYLKELEDKLEVQRNVQESSASSPLKEDIHPSFADVQSGAQDGRLVPEGGDLTIELSAEEIPSGDEYECISPDDMSLPPLSETPESNLPQSETEQEDAPSCSSQSLHVSSYSMQIQINTGSKRAVGHSELLTHAASTDTSDNKREKTSNYVKSFYSPPLGFHPKFRIESPSVPHPPVPSTYSTTSHALPGALKANAACSMTSEVHETHLQHHTVQKSMRETQEQLHTSNTCTNSIDLLRNSPDALSGLMFQSDLPRSSPRQMVIQEEMRSASEKTSMTSLSGQSPNFSKLLSNATVKEGSPVTLEVEVTGFPEPTLTWYKKGQKLSTDEKLKLLQKGTKHSVFIQKVCEEDGGRYVALATNSNGSKSISAALYVKDNRAPIKRLDWFSLLALVISVLLLHLLLTR